MDQANQYLQQELAKLDLEVEKVKKLLGSDVDVEAQGELAKLEEQKRVLELAMAGGEQSGREKVEEEKGYRAVIVEIRPGVGGEEAKIWAGDLGRMYTRYANYQGWKVEELDEGVLRIAGKTNVFGIFRWETGVHRVQRVPETEAAGRIHTSTASVVVLPEVAETEVEIKEDDLAWEFTRSGGHGGQNVNKVATAVRLTHKPTGVMVQSRQERFQEQNRKIALSLLRARLWEMEQEKKEQLVTDQRLAIGRSMRAEKIRTYNYPANRVTDHRAGKSWHKLDRIMEGELGDVFEAISTVTPVNS